MYNFIISLILLVLLSFNAVDAMQDGSYSASTPNQNEDLPIQPAPEAIPSETPQENPRMQQLLAAITYATQLNQADEPTPLLERFEQDEKEASDSLRVIVQAIDSASQTIPQRACDQQNQQDQQAEPASKRRRTENESPLMPVIQTFSTQPPAEQHDSTVDVRGRTQLHRFIMMNPTAITASSLESYLAQLPPETDLNSRDLLGNTALHYAAAKCNWDVIRTLLVHGANPRIQNILGNIARTIAHLHHRGQIFEKMVKFESSVSSQHQMVAPTRDTSSHMKPKSRSRKQKSMRRSVKLPVPQLQETPRARYPSQSQMLAQMQPAASHIAINPGANDLLSQFIRQNISLQEFQQLIASGSHDVNFADAYGNTPLHAAVFHSRPDLIKLLLENNANIFATNLNGFMPIDCAAPQTRSCSLLMKALLDYANH